MVLSACQRGLAHRKMSVYVSARGCAVLQLLTSSAVLYVTEAALVGLAAEACMKGCSGSLCFGCGPCWLVSGLGHIWGQLMWHPTYCMLYLIPCTLCCAVCPSWRTVGEHAFPAAGRVVAGQSCRRASACIICAHVMIYTRPLTHMAVHLGVRLLGC